MRSRSSLLSRSFIPIHVLHWCQARQDICTQTQSALVDCCPCELSSKVECLIQCGCLDARVGQLGCKGLHNVFVAVNKEGAAGTSLFMPCQQLCLIRMGRKSVDRVYA